MKNNITDIVVPEFFDESTEEGKGVRVGSMIETQGSVVDHDQEKLFAFLENEGLENGAVSQSETQFYDMWRVREDIPLSQMAYGGPMYSYDINVPDIRDIYPL